MWYFIEPCSGLKQRKMAEEKLVCVAHYTHIPLSARDGPVAFTAPDPTTFTHLHSKLTDLWLIKWCWWLFLYR